MSFSSGKNYIATAKDIANVVSLNHMHNFQAADKTWLLILGVHLHPVHPLPMPLCNDTEWPVLCLRAAKELLTHSILFLYSNFLCMLYNFEYCICCCTVNDVKPVSAFI